MARKIHYLPTTDYDVPAMEGWLNGLPGTLISVQWLPSGNVVAVTEVDTSEPAG